LTKVIVALLCRLNATLGIVENGYAEELGLQTTEQFDATLLTVVDVHNTIK
jgi:hypothetical protein